jgi:hypothetical protein
MLYNDILPATPKILHKSSNDTGNILYESLQIISSLYEI